MLDRAAPPAPPAPPEESTGASGADADPVPKRVPAAVVAAVAGVLVGAGIVGVLALSGVFDTDPRRPDAQDELIAAYERYRGTTYAFDGSFTRTMPDGRRLESGAFVVQRPPDELRRQVGGTSGRLNGRRVNCATDPDGRFQCATGAEVEPWDRMVARELDNLRSYFDPAAPAYTATRLPGDCFELRLVAPVVDPPYGVRAVLCFDGPTGALRSIEVEHEGGAVDRLEAAAVRATVTDADFGLEGQDRYSADETTASTGG